MLTETVDVHEAQADFAKLLSLVLKGVKVILARDGKPLARLEPIAPSDEPRVAGLHQGTIWISDDFDEPLPDTFWMGAI